MSILNIVPAVRGGSKVIINICGPSGSGKTYTALKIARGMVSKASEIGFLDTENKRGSLYADILDGQFMIGDLIAPFSPKRYSDAIKEFQDSGVKVLVIDSVSHEWEGSGGCEEIAESAIARGSKMADWNKAKFEHKRFMNTLLQCNMHLVICVRARQKMDFKNHSKPTDLGIQPVCEKNFMFEATASIMMYDEGKKQEFIKVPSFFKPIFGDGNSYLGELQGNKILEWVDKGEKESETLSKFKSEMQMITENGLEALKESWIKGLVNLSKEDKAKANSSWKTFEGSAIGYDEACKQPESSGDLFDKLFELYNQKKDLLTPTQKTDINRIIDETEQSSYQKAIDILTTI